MEKRTYLTIFTDSKDFRGKRPTPSLSSIACVYHIMDGEAAVVTLLEQHYRMKMTPVVTVPTPCMSIEMLREIMSVMTLPGSRKKRKDMIDVLIIDLGPSDLYPTVDDALEAVFKSDGDILGPWWSATGYKFAK